MYILLRQGFNQKPPQIAEYHLGHQFTDHPPFPSFSVAKMMMPLTIYFFNFLYQKVLTIFFLQYEKNYRVYNVYSAALYCYFWNSMLCLQM